MVWASVCSLLIYGTDCEMDLHKEKEHTRRACPSYQDIMVSGNHGGQGKYLVARTGVFVLKGRDGHM